MIYRAFGEIGLTRKIKRRTVAHSSHVKRSASVSLRISANPSRERCRERGVLQWIDHLRSSRGIDIEPQLANGSPPDLRQERIELEIERLGREHLLQQSILP